MALVRKNDAGGSRLTVRATSPEAGRGLVAALGMKVILARSKP